MFCTSECFVQVVDISLVMFSMVDLHRLSVDMWFKSVVGVGERRK